MTGDTGRADRRDCRVRARLRNYARRMTLRMHPVSASRWEQLAESRHPIDLTEEANPRPRADIGIRRRSEHADIQAQLARIAARRASAIR